MERFMTEKPKMPSEFQKESAVMPAIVRANEMLREVCGPRGWNDTRETWLARGARRIGMSPRRARALFYQEPIRLSADEYFAIERAYTMAHASVASLSALARHADLRASDRDGAAGGGPDGEGRPVDRQERQATASSFRPAGE